ncbi:MAG: 5'/3'-nucleotidase SurE [Nitrospirota bacterium]|nr:5'/3'-nucleotidase SurE [Nitrospirota bacterium]
MRIVVTNDDGIHSPGLTALAKALSKLGEVWVVAPDRERTAAAHAVTLHKPLRVQQLGARMYAVSGTPVDCVNLAVLKILPAPPDLLVSGINRGVNLGDDVLYSGTVSAAMEGTILGIPSMAVSQEGQEHFYFDAGARYAVRIARLIMKEGLPDETLVNLNIPNRPFTSITGVRVTCLSRRRFHNPIIEKVDPRGRTYYWIAGTRVSWSRSKDADHEALEQGAVSLTPIHLDTTNHAVLDRFRTWETVRRPGARQVTAAVKPKGKKKG